MPDPVRSLPDNLRISVWSRDYELKGPVRAVGDVTFTPRVHAASSLTFQVAEQYLDTDGKPVQNRAIPHLRADGARLVVSYTTDGGPPVIRSGLVGELGGEGRSGDRVLSFGILDDWADIFAGTLGWPRPGNGVGTQGDDKTKWSQKAPAETVLLALVAANRARLGKPLTIPTSLGRGDEVTVAVRMQPLSDVLWPTTESVVAEVYQQGTARVLTVREPQTITRVFTEASGAVVSGTYLLKAPTTTRVVIGWGGKKKARLFAIYPTSVAGSPSTSRTAVETAWGLVMETFVDGDSLDITDADFADQRKQMVDEAMTAGAPQSSVSAVIAETDRLRFGKSFQLGDRLKIQLAGGPVVEETLREVEIAWTGDGLTVTPKVGLWEESPEAALYRKVAASDRRLRLVGAG